MKREKVIANLVADGWGLDAAKAAAKVINQYESALPLPGLVKLGKIIDVLRRAA